MGAPQHSGTLAAWQAEHGDALHGREGLRGLLVQSITSRRTRMRKLAEARISAWILRVKQRWYNSTALQCAAAGAAILARKLHADALRQTRSLRGSGGQQDAKFANVQFGKDAARRSSPPRSRPRQKYTAPAGYFGKVHGPGRVLRRSTKTRKKAQKLAFGQHQKAHEERPTGR